MSWGSIYTISAQGPSCDWDDHMIPSDWLAKHLHQSALNPIGCYQSCTSFIILHAFLLAIKRSHECLGMGIYALHGNLYSYWLLECQMIVISLMTPEQSDDPWCHGNSCLTMSSINVIQWCHWLCHAVFHIFDFKYSLFIINCFWLNFYKRIYVSSWDGNFYRSGYELLWTILRWCGKRRSRLVPKIEVRLYQI